MANTKRVQLRKGTELEHSTFTGALAEVTFDTDKGTIRSSRWTHLVWGRDSKISID